MDLRHMRHFVAVAEERHFGRAAKRLNLAQPPLSQSIQRLEASLGVVLLDRSRRSVELTDAGRIFYAEAQRTLAQAELTRKLTQRESVKTPEVRLAFRGPALYRILPELISHHRATQPAVHLKLLELSSSDQMKGMLAGDIDVGLINGSTACPPHFETVLVERTRFIAAIPAQWSLARAKSITLAELAGHPFIRPPIRHAVDYNPPDGEPLWIFKPAGVRPNVVQEASQINTSLSLVGAGIGCSIVMTTAKLTQWRNVSFVPISDLSPASTLEMKLAWLPHHVGKLGSDFVAFVRSFVGNNPHLLDPDAPLD